MDFHYKARNNDIHTHTYVIHLACNGNVLESFRSWHNLLLCPFYVHFHQLYLLALLSGLPVSGSHCLILLCFKYNQSYGSILTFVMINIPFSLHPPCLSYIKLFPKEHDRRGKMNKEELLTANCGSTRSVTLKANRVEGGVAWISALDSCLYLNYIYIISHLKFNKLTGENTFLKFNTCMMLGRLIIVEKNGTFKQKSANNLRVET